MCLGKCTPIISAEGLFIVAVILVARVFATLVENGQQFLCTKFVAVRHCRITDELALSQYIIESERMFGFRKETIARSSPSAFTSVPRIGSRKSGSASRSIGRATSLSRGCLDHRITAVRQFRRLHSPLSARIAARVRLRECRSFVIYELEN